MVHYRLNEDFTHHRLNEDFTHPFKTDKNGDGFESQVFCSCAGPLQQVGADGCSCGSFCTLEPRRLTAASRGRAEAPRHVGSRGRENRKMPRGDNLATARAESAAHRRKKKLSAATIARYERSM